MTPRPPRSRRTPLTRATIAVLLLVATAACGDRAERSAATTAAPTTPATNATAAASVAPATSAPATTAPAVASTAVVLATVPPPTAAPTTATLPTPIMPPPEYQVEPEFVVGRISIPRLELDLDLFSGITLPTLDKGPGHWPGTALPGQPGNVVIAGHRVSSTRPFRYIDELVEGDDVTFTVDGVASRYVVTRHEIVTPDAIRIIEQTPARTATLFACHPPGSTEFRWVVHLVAAD